MDIQNLHSIEIFNWPTEESWQVWRHITNFRIINAKTNKAVNAFVDSTSKNLVLLGVLLGRPSFSTPTVSPLVRLKIERCSIDYGHRNIRDSNRGLWALACGTGKLQCWYKLENPRLDYRDVYAGMVQAATMILAINDCIDSFSDTSALRIEDYLRGKHDLLEFLEENRQFVKSQLKAKIDRLIPEIEDSMVQQTGKDHCMTSSCIEGMRACVVCLVPDSSSDSFDMGRMVTCQGECRSDVHVACYGLKVRFSIFEHGGCVVV